MTGGELIESVSAKDKEFHFQNWFEQRLAQLPFHFEGSGRNAYPDFSLVERAEGYEIKGLAWPGRERDYDSNSQVPTGVHNGRQIFYVFGRYPADLGSYPDSGSGRRQYPVVDLVVCHGDFLNADHDYVHKIDLRTNELTAQRIPNPRAGTAHRFVAYRLKNQTAKPVSMLTRPGVIRDEVESVDT